MCGLECDGARYHSGWRARTSDVWRQEILESKGWKILRIWSTDWFENSEVTKNRLAKELIALRYEAQSTIIPVQEQFIRRSDLEQSINEVNETSRESLNKTVKTIEASQVAKSSTPAITQPDKSGIAHIRESTEVCVEVGDTVEYEFIDEGRLASSQIVRGLGDPTSGRINRDSPLAKALLDNSIGDQIPFLSPSGIKNLVVRAIHRN